MTKVMDYNLQIEKDYTRMIEIWRTQSSCLEEALIVMAEADTYTDKVQCNMMSCDRTQDTVGY